MVFCHSPSNINNCPKEKSGKVSWQKVQIQLKGNKPKFQVMLNLFTLPTHVMAAGSLSQCPPGTPGPSGLSCPRMVLQHAGAGGCSDSKNHAPQNYHSPLIHKDRGCLLRAKPLGPQQRMLQEKNQERTKLSFPVSCQLLPGTCQGLLSPSSRWCSGEWPQRLGLPQEHPVPLWTFSPQPWALSPAVSAPDSTAHCSVGYLSPSHSWGTSYGFPIRIREKSITFSPVMILPISDVLSSQKLLAFLLLVQELLHDAECLGQLSHYHSQGCLILFEIRGSTFKTVLKTFV